MASLAAQLALQCTYTHTQATPTPAQPPVPPAGTAALATRAGGAGAPPMRGTGAVTYTHPAAAAVGAPQPRQPAAGLRYRFVVAVRAARDVALPLNLANIFCRFSYPMLEGAGGQSKVVRSAPPVLLPRRGEVSLPNAATVYELCCEPRGCGAA